MKVKRNWASFLVFVLCFIMILVPQCASAEQWNDPIEEEPEEEIYYGVLEDDSFQYDLDFDPELVKTIQKALNRYLKKHAKNYHSISVDGNFGANTAQAVKLFQYKKGLKIDGVCGPKTLRALGLDPTGITSYPRWMPNLEESFEKSTSGMALHLNLGSHKLEVYRKVDGEWRLIRVMLAATGNYKEGNFTDLTDQNIGKTKHSYIAGGNWRGYHAVGIQRGDFFHSVLAHKKNGKWVFDDNSALGHDVSHGCVRLARENAKWLHENVEPGTTCVVDDRAWDFDLTH